MRKIAPLMYLGGLAMVVMQIGAAYSVISGMVHPSCTSNTHCDRPGFFCYIQPGEERGKCQMCGASAAAQMLSLDIPCLTLRLSVWIRLARRDATTCTVSIENGEADRRTGGGRSHQ